MLITIEVTSIEELDKLVARLGGSVVKDAIAAPKADSKAPAAPKEPAKEAVKEPAKEAVKDPAKEVTKEGEISYAKDIAPRVLKLAEAKGRPAALEVLAKFGVEKAPQLKAEQYSAFIAAVDTALDV